MKKTIQLLIFLAFISTYSQNLTITYKVKFKNDQKEELYNLIIINNDSDFYLYKKAINDSLYNDPNIDLLVSKRNNNLSISSIENNLITTTAMPLPDNWELTNDTDIIEKTTVYGARINYNNKTWTAYYSPEYKIAEGPFIFKNLPGLIWRLYDDKNEIKFDLVSISNEALNLKDIKNAKPLKFDNFIEYKLNKIKKDNILISELMKTVNLKNHNAVDFIKTDKLINILK